MCNSNTRLHLSVTSRNKDGNLRNWWNKTTVVVTSATPVTGSQHSAALAKPYTQRWINDRSTNALQRILIHYHGHAIHDLYPTKRCLLEGANRQVVTIITHANFGTDRTCVNVNIIQTPDFVMRFIVYVCMVVRNSNLTKNLEGGLPMFSVATACVFVML